MSTEESGAWEPSTAAIGSLAEMFGMQDRWMQSNWAKAPAEFALIERGLVLAFDVTMWLHDEPVASQRKATSPDVQDPETICADLLHAACGSLVSATRLALAGDAVDALALTRVAFEAVYHAEYFRLHPAEALEWDKIGATLDVYDIRNALRAFEQGKHVRETIRQQYGGPGGSHDAFFVELSTYGTHINPKTVSMRLSVPGPNRGNLGFVSDGLLERPLLCADRILNVVLYTVSEFLDGLGHYISLNAPLAAAVGQFQDDVNAHMASVGPRGLSYGK